MSIEATSWAWRQQVKGTQKLVLLALADFADKAGVCWPAVKTISEFACVGRSSVQRALGELETAGLIERAERANSSNRYRLLWGAATQGPPVTQGGGGPSDGAGGAREAGHKPPVEPPQEPNAADAAVEAVWAYWVERRQPSKTKLPDGIHKMLKRALNADFDVDTLKRAINGLLASEWHRERPHTLTLSTIFATRPGGPAFEEQVQSWVERGAAGVQRSSLKQGWINSQKEMVRQTWRSESNVELRQSAIDELAREGIDVIDNNGRPQFVERPR